mgnify:CR=1 FL=1
MIRLMYFGRIIIHEHERRFKVDGLGDFSSLGDATQAIRLSLGK